MLGAPPRFRIPRGVAVLEPRPLSGRVCVVTGASAGIGLETAYRLAAWDATVVLVGRDVDKTAAAGAAIGAATDPARVHTECCDFASLAEVHALADRLLALHPAIHVLVNNAGLWLKRRQQSADGHEMTFAVNHLAPFVLTKRLIGRLEESAPARVVNVSSRLHIRERAFLFDDVAIEKRRYTGLSAYRQSKLANVLFSNELARRYADRGVTSNAVHPGDVATTVVRDSRFLSWGIRWVGERWLLTPEEGARTSVYVASDPAFDRQTGGYFANCRPATVNPVALDEATAARLWSMSEDLA